MPGQYSESDTKISFRRILRKIFIDDWPMKVIAAVITLAIYLGVQGEVVTGTLTVPLDLRISDNTEFAVPPDKQVDVVLEGDKSKIDDMIRKKDVSVFCDLTNTGAGDHVVDLEPGMVYNLAPGVTVKEVRPKQVLVKLEPVIEKDIPVRVEKSGEVADGSEIYDDVVIPARVRVRGPASVINSLEFAMTDKIDIGAKTGDFTAHQVGVSVSNPKARVLNAFVDVVFHIGERRGERLVSAAIKGDSAGGKSITLTIIGTLSALKILKPGEVKVEMVTNEAGEKVPQLVDVPAELQGKIQIKKENRTR